MNKIEDANKFFSNLEWVSRLLEYKVKNGEPLPIGAAEKVMEFSKIVQQLEVQSEELRRKSN